MIFGTAAGWFIRSHFDRKASCESLKREIFKEYMVLTDSGGYGPYALQRSGALRLTKEEFNDLLGDIERTGRPPLEDGREHDFIGGFGLFEVLHLVSSQKVEARSELVIYQSLVQAISTIESPV